VGTFLIVVRSPGRYEKSWRAVKFYRSDVAACHVVTERDLTQQEIQHFEQRIVAFEQVSSG
jgi:hypothetical protein